MTRPADVIRRMADVAVAVVGLVIASPVLLCLAILVRVRMGHGVLFRQRRL